MIPVPIITTLLFSLFVYKYYTYLYDTVSRAMTPHRVIVTNDILLAYLFVCGLMVYSLAYTFPNIGLAMSAYLLLSFIEET